MPRRATPFISGQYYHFYNRGNNRQVIFFERDNYLYFIKGLKKYLRGPVDILAYALLPTHYHLLVRVNPRDGLSQDPTDKNAEANRQVSLAMQRFGISYTKAINKRFSRVGSLFQGRFQGKPIERYEHLLNLCVYIHANPVKDGLVTCPEDWEFSNYCDWMDLRAETPAERAFLAENFGPPEEYRRLMMQFIERRFMPDDYRKYIHGYE